jgi:hypothetical protein
MQQTGHFSDFCLATAPEFPFFLLHHFITVKQQHVDFTTIILLNKEISKFLTMIPKKSKLSLRGIKIGILPRRILILKIPPPQVLLYFFTHKR